MIKLALSDMDNTLIPFGASRASERAVKAIHAVLDAGLMFGPCTGRDCVELAGFFAGDEACYRTGVLSNGKRVLADGKTASLSLFDREKLVKIARALDGHDNMFMVCYPEASTLGNPGYAVRTTKEHTAFFEARNRFEAHLVDEVPEFDIIGVTIACAGGEAEMETCRRIVAETGTGIPIVSPVPDWFDLLIPGVTKASALDVLLEATGLAPDEIVIFGDGENDLEVLSKIPYSVAVSNAIDEIKDVANYHIGACEDGAVADALLQIVDAAKTGEMPAFLR